MYGRTWSGSVFILARPPPRSRPPCPAAVSVCAGHGVFFYWWKVTRVSLAQRLYTPPEGSVCADGLESLTFRFDCRLFAASSKTRRAHVEVLPSAATPRVARSSSVRRMRSSAIRRSSGVLNGLPRFPAMTLS